MKHSRISRSLPLHTKPGPPRTSKEQTAFERVVRATKAFERCVDREVLFCAYKDRNLELLLRYRAETDEANRQVFAAWDHLIALRTKIPNEPIPPSKSLPDSNFTQITYARTKPIEAIAQPLDRSAKIDE